MVLPRVLGPAESGLSMPSGALLGPGTGDNAGAALGLGAVAGDVVVSIGTSGVACAVADAPVGDVSGAVAGFADATGRFLPLVATLNAARVLDAACRMLGVSHEELSELALSAPAGAGGLVLVPYLEGERTPNKPDATGAIHGLRLETANPAYLARAAVEGMICGLADAVDAVRALGHAGRADHPGRRRGPLARRTRDRVGRPRAAGDGARAGGVRRARRRPPGRLGARGRRRAAGVAAVGVVSTEVEPTPSVRSRYAVGARPDGACGRDARRWTRPTRWRRTATSSSAPSSTSSTSTATRSAGRWRRRGRGSRASSRRSGAGG